MKDKYNFDTINADDYPMIRKELQQQASKCLDAGNVDKAIVALELVKRLDQRFMPD